MGGRGPGPLKSSGTQQGVALPPGTASSSGRAHQPPTRLRVGPMATCPRPQPHADSISRHLIRRKPHTAKKTSCKRRPEANWVSRAARRGRAAPRRRKEGVRHCRPGPGRAPGRGRRGGGPGARVGLAGCPEWQRLPPGGGGGGLRGGGGAPGTATVRGPLRPCPQNPSTAWEERAGSGKGEQPGPGRGRPGHQGARRTPGEKVSEAGDMWCGRVFTDGDRQGR